MKPSENTQTDQVGLVTLPEAAALAACSVSTLKRQHRRKRLKFIRLGHRTVRVRKAELLRFLATLEK